MVGGRCSGFIPWVGEYRMGMGLFALRSLNAQCTIEDAMIKIWLKRGILIFPAHSIKIQAE